MATVTEMGDLSVTPKESRKLDQARQNEAARRLLREWLSDTSGYDEEAWPQAKAIIEENRLSPRNRFDD